MPIGCRCVFCGQVTGVNLWTGVCDPCWDAAPDPWLKLEQMLAAGEIVRQRGSLAPTLQELRQWREAKEREAK